MSLRQKLEAQGVTLIPKLTFQSATPLDAGTLELLNTYKAELLKDLVAPGCIPRLPWQLERLLAAANCDVLPQGLVRLEGGIVFDFQKHVLTGAATYLIGDREEALKRLWQAHRAWQGGSN